MEFTYEQLKEVLIQMGFEDSEISEDSSMLSLGIDSTEMVDMQDILAEKYETNLSQSDMTQMIEKPFLNLAAYINEKMAKSKIIAKLPVKMEDVTPLTNKGGVIHVLISPKTVKATKLIMGNVVLKPQEELAAHLHDYGEESIYVISGSGKLYVDDNEVNLEADTAAIVPQKCVHRILNTGTEELKLVFATAPLAPKAEAGDRKVN